MTATPAAVLTIGASDSSGCSGIQADLRTLAAMRIHGATVVSAVTARNTTTTSDVYPVPATVVSAQLSAVLDDLPIAAVKTGTFPTAEAVAVVTARARAGALPNLVVDPELAEISPSRRAVVAAVRGLLPYALVATPNRDEASALLGWEVVTPTDMAAAAAQLADQGPRYVVITGGDFVTGGETIDVLWGDGAARMLHGPRITGPNSTGSGATFATAVAARLASGDRVADAVAYAKGFVRRAIGDAAEWRLGAGSGPVDQFGWSAVTLRGGFPY